MAIRNERFINDLIKYSHSRFRNRQINLKNHMTVKNMFLDPEREEKFSLLKKHLYICWTEESVLYLRIDIGSTNSKEADKKLFEWLNHVTHNKIFEYAFKILNKEAPQENPLWFCSETFQPLDALLVNEIEKAVLKAYFRSMQTSTPPIMLKSQELKTFLRKKKSLLSNYKDLKLEMNFQDCMSTQDNDLETIKQTVREVENLFYENDRITFIQNLESLESEHKNKNIVEKCDQKKKKKPKRGKKKLSHSPPTNNTVLDQDSPKKTNKSNIELEVQKDEQELFEKQEIQVPENQSCNSKKKAEESTKQFELDEESFQKGEEQQCQCQKINASNSKNGSPQKRSKKRNLVHKSSNRPKSPEILGRYENTKDNQKGLQEFESESFCSGPYSYQGYEHKDDGALTETITVESTDKICECEETKSTFGSTKEDESCFKDMSETQNKNKHHRLRQQKKQSQIIRLQEQMCELTTKRLINKQMTNFIDSLSIETNNLYESKVICFERVRYFIKNIFPNTEAILFGSNAVGLSLPSSDIDIMLHNIPRNFRGVSQSNPNSSRITKEEINQILARIAIEINAMGWIVSCSTYLKAKVPLVKLEIDPLISYFETKHLSDYHSYQFSNLMLPNSNEMLLSYLDIKDRKKAKNIKVDLTINMEIMEDSTKPQNLSSKSPQTGSQPHSQDNHSNFSTNIINSPSTQLMRQWLGRYPALQRIIIAFKYILAEKGYNENFKGGIGSYCLFVMISAYYTEFCVSELGKEDEENEGKLFLDILKFYSEDFENKLYSITLTALKNQDSEGSDSSCFISLQQSLDFSSELSEEIILSNPLRIIDPLSKKIISSSCYEYENIKAEFKRIRREVLDVFDGMKRQIAGNMTTTLELGKVLGNQKSIEKWVNKYESRNRFSIKKIIDKKL